MTKLFVVRHGQTDFNKQGICQGGASSAPLNETGRAQAQAAAMQLKDIHFDAFVCSPLLRTRETCDIILASNKSKVTTVYDDRLKERDYAALDGKVVSSEKDMKPTWDMTRDGTIDGIETIAALQARVYGALEDIATKYRDKTVLVVCHGGVCRAIYYYFNPKPADGNLYEYQSGNCRVETYTI